MSERSLITASVSTSESNGRCPCSATSARSLTERVSASGELLQDNSSVLDDAASVERSGVWGALDSLPMLSDAISVSGSVFI